MTKTSELAKQLVDALAELPMFDVHTHLVGGQLGAQGLHDVLLYHMVISDLYAAGCPSGNRLTEYPGWPSREEAQQRLEETIPFLPNIRNTSSFWAVKRILCDLYGWTEPITSNNWQRLDGMIRERAEDRAWHHSILDNLNIVRTGTEIARRENGEDDDRFEYSLEWGFFTRTQWGEYDTALYELERCWGKQPTSPMPIGAGGRPSTERTTRTVDDVRDAVHYYADTIPYDLLVSMATHISTDIDFCMVSEDAMSAALARRDQAGPIERDIYASYVNEQFLTALEKHGEEIVFQFSLGAEPLPHETSSRLSQRTIAQIGEFVSRHPKLRFQCFLSSRHANQSMCTLCRELPNLSLCGYWWHNFFPGVIQQVIAERLDMLPVNKQIGFFSDAYSVEWTYGKAVLVRKQLAVVLAEKIEQGQYTFDEALDIVRAIFYETPQTLLGMSPR